jgi:hypothetical protein
MGTRIAVLIPAHNQQDYIAVTIEGVQAQTRGYVGNVTVSVPAGTKAGTYYAVVWTGPKATTPTASANISLQIYAGILPPDLRGDSRIHHRLLAADHRALRGRW